MSSLKDFYNNPEVEDEEDSEDDEDFVPEGKSGWVGKYMYIY